MPKVKAVPWNVSPEYVMWLEKRLLEEGILKVPMTGLSKPKKTKRTPTAYQKKYSRAYKQLKKKHPRMSFGSLSKKAHRLARA